MKLWTCFCTEFQKARRRPTFLFLLALLFFFAFYFLRDMAGEDPAGGQLRMLYSLHLWNGLLTPVIIAIYASRIADVEHRGNTEKLLETLAPRTAIFGGKLLFGTLGILLFVLGQTGIFALVTVVFHCPVDADAILCIRSFCNIFLCCMILLLLHIELATAFVNQAITIVTGLAGTFLGFFLLFLGNRTLYLTTPWSLVGGASLVQLHWDSVTRERSFVVGPGADHAGAAVCLWLLFTVLLGVVLLRHMEDGQVVFASAVRKRRKEKRGHYPKHLPLELLKMRRTPVWLAFLVLPTISALIGTINYIGNLEILTSRWYSLYSQHTLFLAFLFFPALIALFVSYSLRLEHTGTNWNQLLVHEPPHRIIFGKLLLSAFFSALCIVWTTVLYFLAGLLVGLRPPFPPELIDWMFFGWLGALVLCALQILLSLIIKSFVLPILLSLFGAIPGLIVDAYGHRYLLPYSYLAVGLRANNPGLALDYGWFTLLSVLWIVGCTLAAILYLKHSDVKTN